MDIEHAAETLREFVIDNMPDIAPSWYYDALLGAIDSVAWDEVAAAFAA